MLALLFAGLSSSPVQTAVISEPISGHASVITVSNVSLKLGETWALDVTCHDSLGDVISLAGCAVRWRLVAANGAVLLDLALGSGIALVNGGTAGECMITVTPAMQSAAGIPAGFCRHQCRVTLSDGVTVTDQFYGAFKVQPSLF